MRLFSLAALPLLARIAGAASYSPYNLDGVKADISAYLDHNDAHATRSVSNLGCDVAVSSILPAPSAATPAVTLSRCARLTDL